MPGHWRTLWPRTTPVGVRMMKSMKRLTLLAPFASVLLCACQTPAPGPQGDAVALARDAMVQAGRDAEGPLDAAAAASAVGGLRGEGGGSGGEGGVLGGLLGGG